ncbi:VWA domain-containing protein [Brumimicrobium salinarum]|uniref:VWA domain-containing protein n=1 Tax=Brumimicrobium salinarum TaxID=2058658 RepID=A0A2I0R518_9FLAO|nr:VWA domain-containing protein [Brumimicrobium salinarum]PKR81684.1 VWA domain-containing protein [Brumimicrobium salinarum]
MFLDFFLLLREKGIPVTLREYLDLLAALDANIAEYNIDDFYFLSRTVLVKREEHLDLYDQVFGAYFKGIEQIQSSDILNIPDEWLRKNGERLFSKEELEKIKSQGDLESLLDRMAELLKEQKERHQGGNKWIGTGGTSPFGAYGYNPEGIRIGQDKSRHRSAIKVWDKRNFKDLSQDEELETRNIKMALRKLRILSREGRTEEIDLDKTIKSTAKNSGMLEVEMVPSKKNVVKVLLLFDIGGSMDDHIELCSQLFSAAKYEFKHLEFYYFHNCLYENVWKNNERRWEEKTPTETIFNTFNEDYRVIFVGDASMSPYEIVSRMGSVEHYNDEAGQVWLQRMIEHFPYFAWLNPVDKNEWKYTQSIGMIQKIMKNRMFPLTIGGIEEAVEALKNRERF